MNGFPITKLIHQTATAYAKELVRVRAEELARLPAWKRDRLEDYRSVRFSDLVDDVEERVASMLYYGMPTLYREYRRERKAALNSSPPLTAEATT